jgi:hypothetical protein
LNSTIRSQVAAQHDHSYMNWIVHAKGSVECEGLSECEVRGRKPKVMPIIELTRFYALHSHAGCFRGVPSIEVQYARTEKENNGDDTSSLQSAPTTRSS